LANVGLRWPLCLAALPAAIVEFAAAGEVDAFGLSEMSLDGNAGVLQGRAEL
jgi:hypothetical protein